LCVSVASAVMSAMPYRLIPAVKVLVAVSARSVV
jgi:hypothetical protein